MIPSIAQCRELRSRCVRQAPLGQSPLSAPTLENSISMPFPSVNEAIRYADPATAERELADLTARVDRARAALEDATGALR